MRLPQVSTAGNLLVPASILPSDAQLQLEGVRFAFITFGSGLAQWHYWNSSSATWLAIGPLTPVGAGVESLPNEWSRINIRRELASLNEADIWLNGKPVAVKVPLDINITGFQLRASPAAKAYVDALTFSEYQPLFVDGDRDGMPDFWEFLYSGVGAPSGAPALTPSQNDREADPDGDGVSNIREYLAGSNPLLADTDSDSMPDAWEIQYGLNPADSRDANGDFDYDGVLNSEEWNWGTSPRAAGGNGSNIKYLRAAATPSQNDLSQPIGSLANPYDYFETAFQSVPDGGKLVIIGGGQPFYVSASDDSTRSFTITGVNDAKITGGTADKPALSFTGSPRTVTVDNLTFLIARRALVQGHSVLMTVRRKSRDAASRNAMPGRAGPSAWRE